MPRISGTLLGDNLTKVLVHTDPLKFRIRTNKTKSDPSMVAYFDPTISPPKKNWCDLELVTVSNPPPPEFLSIIRVDGLPVPPPVPILVQAVRDLVAHYDSVKNVDGLLNWKPPKKAQKKIKKLSTQHFTASDSPYLLDESFMKIALALLKRLYAISPELSPHIGALIHRCEQKGYLPSLDDPTVTEIKKPTFMTHVGRQQSLDDSAISFNVPGKFVSSQASLREVVPTIHLTSPPQQTATCTLSRTEIVYHIAKQVVDILHKIHVECAIFGSLGCHLYGNERSPNVHPRFFIASSFDSFVFQDIDLLALPPTGIHITVEWLKRAIVKLDSENFCLELPKDPKATFRILYFIVDDKFAPANTFHKNKCKIDILFPNTLHLPSLPKNEIKWQHGLPIIPFSVLLLQKLQGWDDHRKMAEHYKYEKQFTDASDVQNLLKLEHVVSLRFSQPWSDRRFFCDEFQALSIQRVKDFCREYPTSKEEWVRLGFHVSYDVFRMECGD